MQITITDCLGRTRNPDKLFEDGSWNCPFCFAAVVVGTEHHTNRSCPNPACFCRPGFPAAVARDLLAKQQELETERVRREEITRFQRDYAAAQAEERRTRERDIEQFAVEQGACVTCALRSMRFGRAAKFTKHRKACPYA